MFYIVDLFWCGRFYKIVIKKYEIELLIGWIWFCWKYQTEKLMALKHVHNDSVDKTKPILIVKKNGIVGLQGNFNFGGL